MGKAGWTILAALVMLIAVVWLSRTQPVPEATAPIAGAPQPDGKPRREGTGAKVLARQERAPSYWTDEQKNQVQARLADVEAKRGILGEKAREAEGAAEGGWVKDMTNQDLKGAILDGQDFVRVNLQGTVLESAKLVGADLSEANLKGVQGQGASLNNTRLVGTDFSGADMRGAHFAESYAEAVFENTDLRGSDFRAAGLIETNMRKADLRHAVFDMASINADLSNSDLRFARFRSADLFGSNFTGANVEGTDFRESTNLTCEQLTAATNWEKAMVDDGLRCEPPQ